MSRRQLFLLFCTQLIIWWVGIGLSPLLPVYAASLGAEPTTIGIFFALLSTSVTAGTAVTGWLTGRKSAPRTLLIGYGVVSFAAVLLLMTITHLWQLVVLLSVVWFCGGGCLALVNWLASLSAPAHRRGSIFGLLGASPALAGVIGGLVMGPVVDHWGYSALFGLIAITYLCLIGLAPRLHVPQGAEPATAPNRGATPAGPLGVLWLLMVANFLLNVGVFAANLGRSLAMDEVGYGATALSLVAAAGSGAALAVAPLMGRLSDRLPRLWLLMALYALAGGALLLLAGASQVTHFVLIATLLAAAGAERGVAAALLSDLLPAAARGRGLALYDSVRWTSGIIGSVGVGYAITWLGLPATALVGALLPLGGMALLLVVWLHATPSKLKEAAKPLEGAEQGVGLL
jgi:MFS family permease